MLKFGCDPEFFAAYKDGMDYDKFLPHKMFAYSPAACEKWDGLKPIVDDPKHPLYFQYKTGSGLMANIVGDGVAFELNFNKPFDSVQSFYDNVHQSKGLLEKSLTQLGFGFFDQPAINFDYRRFWTDELMADERFRMGVIFGCDPDVDAMDVDAICQIVDADRHPYRYGGGHIHISGDDAIAENPVPFVLMLGITLGNYVVANSTHLDGERIRAMYYGKPFKHRVQNYKDGTSGVEYRTPSNEWTTWDFNKFSGMFDCINVALDLLKSPERGYRALEEFSKLTIEAVTTANTGIAQSILSVLL